MIQEIGKVCQVIYARPANMVALQSETASKSWPYDQMEDPISYHKKGLSKNVWVEGGAGEGG